MDTAGRQPDAETGNFKKNIEKSMTITTDGLGESNLPQFYNFIIESCSLESF